MYAVSFRGTDKERRADLPADRAMAKTQTNAFMAAVGMVALFRRRDDVGTVREGSFFEVSQVSSDGLTASTGAFSSADERPRRGLSPPIARALWRACVRAVAPRVPFNPRFPFLPAVFLLLLRRSVPRV